jgi:diguanylate cyclase (GGDEF)-like protein
MPPRSADFGLLAVKFCARVSKTLTMDGCCHRRAWLLAALLWLASPLAHATEPRLAEIEGKLRGRPEHALIALSRVLPSTRGADRVEALVLRGYLQARQNDAAALEQTIAELEGMAAATKADPLATAAADLLRARALSRAGPFGRADRAASAAWAELPVGAPDTLRFHFIETRALLKQRLGKLDEAVALYQESIALADRLGWRWASAEQRISLAYSLFLAQQVERAAAVNAEGLKLAEQEGDLLAQSSGNNVESFFAGAQKRSDDELRALRNAIELAQRAGARREEALGAANLSDFYLQHGDYATALETARLALSPARAVKDVGAEAVALANAGMALIALGRAAEGLSQVHEAMRLLERAESLSQMAEIEGELGASLEKAGLLKQAWQALVEHRGIADEMFRRERRQAVLELQESFDAERRQRELALMGTEKGLKEEQLLGRELQQKLWALAVAVGLLVLLVVVALVRRMRRSNSELNSSNALLRISADVDPLTGLANRRHFVSKMQHIAPDGVVEGSLVLIDIDHFKLINDRHGHATGDAVLVELARRLRSTVRAEDLTVRWGGEEFLILVRSLPQEHVEAMAERLLAAVGIEPVRHGQQTIAVTASIGFATFPLGPERQALPWERAIDLVDTALYLAKAHGRNRAYGVRSLRGQGDATPGAPASLESAWRDGRADLKALCGPAAAQTSP